MQSHRHVQAFRIRSLPFPTFFLLLLVATVFRLQASPASSSAEIAWELNNFRQLGSVLTIAAHPDDENSPIIAWLARGRGYRTAYLSLTRGDGGQNLIGPELREALGVIRTEELLAARHIDGAQQFFSRARDFGFSKTPDETLAIWDRQAVLSDIVRIIREFQPDIITLPFSPDSAGKTHGHHTSSALLAIEAFRLAGDPQAFPEQLATLHTWSPRHIVLENTAEDSPGFTLDIGGFDPVSGMSFGEIAAASRSQHKTQGMGTLCSRGNNAVRFQTLSGEPASHDLFEGIDTSWNRIAGGASLDAHAAALLAHFDPLAPAASLSELLALRRELAALPASGATIAEKRHQLDHIIIACLGLHVESSIPHAEVLAGESIPVTHSAIVRASCTPPVRWLSLRYPTLKLEQAINLALATNQAAAVGFDVALPPETPPSQPYWVRREGTPSLFRVDDPSLIGKPLAPPELPVEFVFEVGGETLVLTDAPAQVITDPVKGETRFPLSVIGPASLRFTQDTILFRPTETHTVEIEVEAARPNLTGELRLELPSGWSARPAQQPVHLADARQRSRVTFAVTAPAQVRNDVFTAALEIDGHTYRNRQVRILYDHLPPLLLQPDASLRAVSLDLQIRGHAVGYLSGAGDTVADALRRMGYAVTELTEADLVAERLTAFDAVVIGIRAFNTRPQLASRLPALFAFAEAGGNLIVQYNTPSPSLPSFAPFPLQLSASLRVTDENAPVSFLAPDHPALNVPNKIGPADFDGWVQERGLYFPSEWDSHFVTLFSCADRGEPQRAGALLIARVGRGYFVYTGLSFFRQLPAGVPGAYRLLANLVSLGK